MRFSVKVLAYATLAAATLTACNGPTAPERELRAARALWVQRRPASYDITVARFCFCTSEGVGPAIVSVRDGVVTSRTYVATGSAVGPTYADLFPSIDGLFQKIDDARRRRAASLSVEYDRAFGFPTVIAIDYDRTMADDEITYRATNFQPR